MAQEPLAALSFSNEAGADQGRPGCDSPSSRFVSPLLRRGSLRRGLLEGDSSLPSSQLGYPWLLDSLLS